MAPAIFRYTSACRAAVVLAVAVAAALLFSSGDLSYISVLVANYFLFFPAVLFLWVHTLNSYDMLQATHGKQRW
jgi:hypothetical protein